MLVDALPGDRGSGLRTAGPTVATRTVALRTAGALGLVVLCYHTSLWSLLRGVTVDTPLAYLGLVPVIAAGLGYVLARPQLGEPEIHDRHIDRIVGIPLVVCALVALVLLPARMSTMYWLWRIDLLTMPMFVAGVIALLFGIRMLWRTKAAVALLLLAWPIPFRMLVTVLLEHLADLTASAVRLAIGVVPLAQSVAGDGISFRVPHGSGGFDVQIASACSGANGLVGFLLVSSAVALALTGSKARKLAWIATGCVLVLALNVLRILLILGVGRFLGQTASVEVLHPVVGLLTFNAGVLVMVLNAHRFGLQLPVRTGPSRTRTVLRAVPTAMAAMATLTVVALVGAYFNHGLTAYDPIASSVGSPRIAAFSRVATRPPGFYAEPVSSIDAGKRFFGEDSSWVRYSYVGVGVPGLRSEVPVLADVITTSNLQSFSDFGLEACYRFHGYAMSGVKRVDLGNGVVGTVLSWQDPNTNLKWTSLYWIWAVKVNREVRYERVVLLLNDSHGARVEAPAVTTKSASNLAIDADELVRGRSSGGMSSRGRELQSFVVTFGRSVVDSASKLSAKLPQRTEGGG
jgi:exosortase